MQEMLAGHGVMSQMTKREAFMKWIYKRNDDKRTPGPLEIFDWFSEGQMPSEKEIVSAWRKHERLCKELPAWPKADHWIAGVMWLRDWQEKTKKGET